MMTYEQFLKQLRRIGRRLIIASVVAPIVYLLTKLTTSTPLSSDEIYMLLTIYTVLFLSGLVVYPSKSEE